MMARSRPLSLRRRFLTLALLMLVGAAVLLVTFIRDYANRASDRAFDRLLSASALSIAGAVQIEDGEVVVELPIAAFAMMSEQERVFYTVLGAQGQHVTGYTDLMREAPLAQSVRPLFADTVHNGHPVRVVTVGRLVSTSEGTGWVTVRVAETRDARTALAAEILWNAVVPVAVLTALALVMVWVVIGRAFAPLDKIDRALRHRRPEDLSPLNVPVPVEVQHLVEGLNGFMARLGLSMDRMGGLVAEAAHQVRNPLAALRAQSEMALTEPDESALRARASRIHDLAVEASHLVSQLLMDATISHRMDRVMTQPLSVVALLEEVLGRLDPDLGPRVSGEIDPAARASVLRGDRIALREALRNLIDNALTYSNGPVEVQVALSARGRVALSVLDRGPGISDAEKPRMLQRFARGSTGAGHVGSGLGLDIARRVAEQHGGALNLLDRQGGGLAAVLDLPLSPEAETPAERTPPKLAAALAGLALCALAARAEAQTVDFPAENPTGQVLRIAGTTDTQIFVDFITGFQALNPGVSVSYTETDSNALYQGFLEGTLPWPPDVLISSASDLQVKLANDGHALTYNSPWLADLPDWAHWRDEVFGFTFEPAVIIYNPRLMPPGTQPRSHTDLATLLEQEPDRFRGRVATYDIAESGVGHLLASQDQQISSQFWRLAAALGRIGARLSDSSPQIIDAIVAGDLDLAYNVLGSYAFARQAGGAPIGIIVPDDYVLALTRTLLIPRYAPSPDLARAFVDFALSPAGQSIAAGRAALGSVRPNVAGPWTQERIAAMGGGAVQPIALRPVLLVGLDPQRRSRFLTTWQEIVAPSQP